MNILDLALEMVWNLYKNGASWDSAVCAAEDYFNLDSWQVSVMQDAFDA